MSILLPIATAVSVSKKLAFASAWVYYLIGSVSITGAITGYYGGHWALGLLAWIGASVALALPWALGRSATGRLFALIATAVPPLGVIGWLSPLNAAGVMFPGTGLFGLGLCVAALIWCDGVYRRPQKTWLSVLLVIAVMNGIDYGFLIPQKFTSTPPSGWVGLDTRIVPGRGTLADLANKQGLIEAGRAVHAARVLVFPEAVLGDWLPGTRQQFALAVPPGQIWLIGAQVRLPTPGLASSGKPVNAVVAVEHGQAHAVPLTAASGLLLGGNWRPWSAQGLRPAGEQRTFALDGERVWAALCVEQLQPWAWVQAMWHPPTLVLAMSNAWWAPPDSFAPRIQKASTQAWARLMAVPVIWADNKPPAKAHAV
ncbi:MAG: conjugal transfer protein TraB [Burkholderiaceae bacterium]|nr:conjugal transfer protein TraB [Burkholderiaceae bacterium]